MAHKDLPPLDDMAEEERHKLHDDTLKEMDEFEADLSSSVPTGTKIRITQAIMTLGPWYEDIVILIRPEDGAIVVHKGQTLTLHAIHGKGE